ncbi:hypothetical protein KEM55_002890 [Ascosphaera atra]|nr:hypothetical protein KEM55_002890 [Ascosphaera atra]
MASSGVNGNGVHANDTPQSFYKVKEAPVGTSRHLRVVMLGAGASGLNLAHQMELHMKDYDLTIYEKNEDVGGTWFENSYQFAWEPNPNWSAYYAPGPEIFQYFQGVAKKYDLYRWIKLNHMVTSAIWDEESATWKLEIQNTRTGEIVKDWAHVFINGGGFLK